MAPVTEEIRPPWKGPTFRQLRPAYRSGFICALAVKADASMLETTKPQYAVRDTRVMMYELLVRMLTVMGAVYNGLEGVYPLKNNGTAGLSLQESLYDSRKLGRRRVEGVLLANALSGQRHDFLF